ncbi:hypothetical protein QWI17_18410 [Gilvimarinus sp. SDUM040013]|uniref:Uncharacterized protein n=1 Tax=Gilvimarinus gilvus TaxID=3058038 RepID=A0ABU4S6L7_9GAMM|nr:hypothetical protein [Gilvimarinus sp. SDUM040013]MDO3387823.1 hypothetical protein [Gilvimarinus sp. SDUM040013]MDX6851034.1 hypothetical protein [Gilvimarinus sp. SDUM040013]
MRTCNHSPDKNNHSLLISRLLREAKRLHRAASSESKQRALPILRRLLASKVLRDMSLIELYRRNSLIQRKHLLQLIAVEAGYNSWALYRRSIELHPQQVLAHYSLTLPDAGYTNLWFSTLSEANAYSKKHGGRTISVGTQAVVVAGLL